MNIEDYEEETKIVEGEVEGGLNSDTPDDPDDDLYESLDLLDGCVELFNQLTEENNKDIDMPLELELEIYKIKEKIKDFTDQWASSNQE